MLIHLRWNSCNWFLHGTILKLLFIFLWSWKTDLDFTKESAIWLWYNYKHSIVMNIFLKILTFETIYILGRISFIYFKTKMWSSHHISFSRNIHFFCISNKKQWDDRSTRIEYQLLSFTYKYVFERKIYLRCVYTYIHAECISKHLYRVNILYNLFNVKWS